MTQPSWILGIETSGLVGSVALVRNGALFAERSLATAGRRHAQTLLAEIAELLQSAGVASREATGVAVSLGPGSFTGLRVGVVCAKTWAYATGCAIAGVETFDALAAQSPAAWQSVWVIADAQRGDFFAAEYRLTEKGGWQRCRPIAIVRGPEWLRQRTAEEHVVGPAALKVDSTATAATVIRETWSTQPSAAQIALLGARRIQAGCSDDPWTLSPVYIRPSAAEEKQDGPPPPVSV